MNEEVENKPVDNDEVELNDADFDSGFNEEFDDVEDTNAEVNTPVETEEVEETEVQDDEDTKQEDKEQKDELDFTPLLSELSKKIKYKDEEIKIDNLEDVITNYQKGKNYDTLQEKLSNLENSEELQYIKELAKENGMQPKEYIKAVREYQEQQKLAKEQEELGEMISNGVPEHIAKKVIETNKVAKELQEEKLQLKKEREEKAQQEKKDAEYLEFLAKYPNVKVGDIPKEVFDNAKSSNLKTAYTEYLLDLKEKEIQKLKNQEKVKQTSPVKGVTQYGNVQKEKVDPFEKGFDDELDF